VTAVAALLLLATTADTPMTNEEVVRLVAAGTPEATILEAIRVRPPAFDVADDMLEELRLAGVPTPVIAAMKTRTVQAAPMPPPAERAPRDTVRLVVDLNGGASRTLHAPAFADEDVKQRLQLPKEASEREVKDLAIFLACTTAEHVPDQWRQKSPLGRDMNVTLRHEMLAFVAGDTPAGKKPRLKLPARLEADVDDVEAHALVLGVAARIGDRWMIVAVSEPAKTKVGAETPPLSGKVAAIAAQPLAFGVELELKKRAPR